jgi:hypothetical protein
MRVLKLTTTDSSAVRAHQHAWSVSPVRSTTSPGALDATMPTSCLAKEGFGS